MADAKAISKAAEGRVRAVIDAVSPSVDGGLFPIARVTGETVAVRADCFTDGHDVLRVMLRHRRDGERTWREVEMAPAGNDRWLGEFVAGAAGRYRYTVCAWVDHFLSWRTEFARREDPADIVIAARVGAQLASEAAERAKGSDRTQLRRQAKLLESEDDIASLRVAALDEAFKALAMRYPDRSLQTDWPVEMPLRVDRARARFSQLVRAVPALGVGGAGSPRHAARLRGAPALRGRTRLRRAVPAADPSDRANPAQGTRTTRWPPGRTMSAAPGRSGRDEGGHKAVHPALGTLEDFRGLVARAAEHGIEIALDIAFQCAPDHPYVKEHPEWFRWRPDGTVQYAENPPKKYQDIYPFDFECEDWRGLWKELRSVFAFWIGEGVRIFRVDNPHTKPSRSGSG